MPRLILSSDTLNPYVDRVTLTDGYELCARCGQPILNGESALVMWRSPEYGAFAHAFKCCSRQPRNWTKILKYEQVSETILWNSERLPEMVNQLNAQSALATKPAEGRKFDYERVTLGPNRLRKNRFEWAWTPGDPNWTRLDRLTGKKEVDFNGGSSTVVIEGRTFPFVSLLDWNHVQNAASMVDVELSLEYPAKYPGLGDEHDGIPSDEKARHRTAVHVSHDDDEFGMSGLVPVTRRIVCENREERKMLERLGILPLYEVVAQVQRRIPTHRSENARESGGKMRFTYHPELYAPRPEVARTSFPKPVVTRALERIIYATVIREERARSYGTGRVVKVDTLPLYSKGFAKDLTTAGDTYYKSKPKVTNNGPGAAQTWDVFGNVVEQALYCDATLRFMDKGRWRKLEHAEYVEWVTRPIRNTLLDTPSFKIESAQWTRLLFPKDDSDLLALVDFWDAFGNRALGSWTPAYERPWQWMGRETDALVPLYLRGEGNLFLGSGDGFLARPALEGA